MNRMKKNQQGSCRGIKKMESVLSSRVRSLALIIPTSRSSLTLPAAGGESYSLVRCSL